MKITLKGEAETRNVWLNGKRLFAAKSQQVWNHSPDGFNWNYSGSGPAQLALAILLELFPKEIAVSNHQDFKFKFIAGLPQGDFDTELEIPDYAKNV